MSANPRAQIPDDGKWLCEDWGCPARVSCKRHFGRSSFYASMAARHPPLKIPERDVAKDFCEHYEFDKPKKWLMPLPGQITHLLDRCP